MNITAFSLQAIQTRYLSPGNVRGARIVAQAAAGRKVYSWQHELNVEQNHIAAAEQFALSKNWTNDRAHGQLADGSYVHVLIAKA